MSGFTNVNLSEGTRLSNCQLRINVNVKASEDFRWQDSDVGVGRSLGAQIAGAANIQIGMLKGSQFAGVTNIATDHVRVSQLPDYSITDMSYGTKSGWSMLLIHWAVCLLDSSVMFAPATTNLNFLLTKYFMPTSPFRTRCVEILQHHLAGVKPDHDFPSNPVWTFGYGLGTAPRLYTITGPQLGCHSTTC